MRAEMSGASSGMKKSRKKQSVTSGFIIIGAIAISFATANPVPFFVALLFVWIFGNKL